MPTALPIRSKAAAAAQRLPWFKMVRLIILLAQVRWLNRRMEDAHRRVARYGLGRAGSELVLAARRWLACHKAISALLGVPESYAGF